MMKRLLLCFALAILLCGLLFGCDVVDDTTTTPGTSTGTETNTSTSTSTSESTTLPSSGNGGQGGDIELPDAPL